MQHRLEDPDLRAQDVAGVLAEAVLLRWQRDSKLRKALQPAIEEAIRISVQRDPRILADSLFPMIGAAIRKALSTALQGMLDSLNQTLEHSFSLRGLRWRIEALRTGRPFGEIVLLRSLRYRVEQVFLIHAKTGLLLAHQAAESAVVKDADMVSGMLTAIQDFVRDSFGSPSAEELETMQVGECGVWVQHGPQALLACVIRGLPPKQLKTVFQSALESIHRELGLELENFQGDAGAFQVCAPHLRACLLGQMGGQEIKRLPYAWVALSLPVLAAAAWVFWSLWESRRWTAYLDSLKEQPGIVITSAGSRGSRYLVSGLRDPLAPDPEQMLERFSIPAGSVTFRWEPYHSFHPRFLAVREFRRYRESVERQVVLFESGRSEVTPQATLNIAADVRALLDSAARAGSQVRVEIVGHADPMGSEALNSKLSQQRAEQVLLRLVEQGIPGNSLLARGAGIAEPVVARSEQQHWLERRVSFRLNPQR